jgi:hypothetical protein
MRLVPAGLGLRGNDEPGPALRSSLPLAFHRLGSRAGRGMAGTTGAAGLFAGHPFGAQLCSRTLVRS